MSWKTRELRVGDRVTIRKDLTCEIFEQGTSGNVCSVVRSMVKLAGQSFTIADIHTNLGLTLYYLNENGSWSWTKNMFE